MSNLLVTLTKQSTLETPQVLVNADDLPAVIRQLLREYDHFDKIEIKPTPIVSFGKTDH